MNDATHMRAALSLARRGLGATWPNPSVGCVIVKDGVVVARARTADGGRPHAETEALRLAGERARGATAYVTLEPCSHFGQTPPCAQALVASGIARCVVALGDPDERVSGAGLALLRDAGVLVELGLEQEAAAQVAAGFVCRTLQRRPLVTLKLASTLDGRIATRSGNSRWVTGEASRRLVHAMRAEHDAVMVGVRTALADNPELTCRLPGFDRVASVRVVADSHLRTSMTGRLAATARQVPVWLLHRDGADVERRRGLEAAGVVCLEVGKPSDQAADIGIDPLQALGALAERGINTVLVEGGAQLAGSLLRASLVDRIVWFHAPALLGQDAYPAVQSLGIETVAAMPRFVRQHTQVAGEDMVSSFGRA